MANSWDWDIWESGIDNILNEIFANNNIEQTSPTINQQSNTTDPEIQTISAPITNFEYAIRTVTLVQDHVIARFARPIFVQEYEIEITVHSPFQLLPGHALDDALKAITNEHPIIANLCPFWTTDSEDNYYLCTTRYEEDPNICSYFKHALAKDKIKFDFRS